MQGTRLVVVAAGVAAMVAAAAAVSPARHPGSRWVAQPESQPLTITARMTAVNRDIRKLGGQVRDAAKTESSLELFQAIGEHMIAVKAMTPDMAATLPEERRAAFVREFRQQVIEAIEVVLRAEKQLLSGDGAAAGATLQGLADAKRQGHARFRVGQDGD